MSRWLRPLIGLLMSVVFLLLALRGVDLSAVWAALRQARLLPVVFALVCVNAVNVAKAVRWQIILRPQAPDVPLARLFAVLMIGQAMNAFAPLRVGDLARAYLLPGVSVATLLYSIMIEKALDSLMLLALLSGVALAMPLPVWLKQSGIVLSLGLTAVLIVLLAAGRGERYVAGAGAWIDRRLPALRRFALARRLGDAAAALGALSHGRILLPLLAWTLASWLLGAAANYLTFAAVGLELENAGLAAAFLIVVLYVGAIVPSSPGKVGVFHYLAVISLALFGVQQGPALVYGIVLHLIVYGPTAVLGAYYIWQEAQRARRLPAK